MSIEAGLQILALPGLPLIEPGFDVGAGITAALHAQHLTLQNDDVLLIAQKIISKAEGRFADLQEVQPSRRAQYLAHLTGKDPRLVEVILWDTQAVIRLRPGLLIVENHLGLICANGGLDRSNVAANPNLVLRLPQNPDDSAAQIRRTLQQHFRYAPPVIITDTQGRPWRNGATGLAIGLAGLHPVQNQRGQHDLFGRPLRATQVALADQLAAAAQLVMGQAAEATPVVLIRGLNVESTDIPVSAQAALRPKSRDFFR